MALNDDVSRLFQRLVEVLGQGGHDRLLDPIDIPDLYQKIIPYRTHRSALQFDTHQDYEMALLRLLSGELGYVEVEPAEVGEALALEARSVNPNPGAFRAFGRARVKLSFRAVKELLHSEIPWAPPAPPTPPASPPRERHWGRPRPIPFSLEQPARSDEPTRAPAPVPANAGECPQCNGTLPAGRVVNFCPHCGGDVNVRDCPECGTGLELEWRHCISCGHRVG